MIVDYTSQNLGNCNNPMEGSLQTNTAHLVLESCIPWLSEQMHGLCHPSEKLLRYPFPGDGQLCHVVVVAMPICSSAFPCDKRSTSVDYTHLSWLELLWLFWKQLSDAKPGRNEVHQMHFCAFFLKQRNMHEVFSSLLRGWGEKRYKCKLRLQKQH